jgi:hypothetical protein
MRDKKLQRPPPHAYILVLARDPSNQLPRRTFVLPPLSKELQRPPPHAYILVLARRPCNESQAF